MKRGAIEKAVGSFLEGEGFRRAAREGVWLRNVGDQLDEIVFERRRLGSRIAVRLRLRDAKTREIIGDVSGKALRGLDYVLDEMLEGIAPTVPKGGWKSAGPQATANIVAALRDEGLSFLKTMHGLIALSSHLERRVREGGGFSLRLHWAVTLARLGQTQRALDALAEAKGLSAAEKKTVGNLGAWALAQGRIERPPKPSSFPKAVGAVLEAAGFVRENPKPSLAIDWVRTVGDHTDRAALYVSKDLADITLTLNTRDNVTAEIVKAVDSGGVGHWQSWPISLSIGDFAEGASRGGWFARSDPEGPATMAHILTKALPRLDELHGLEAARDALKPQLYWKSSWPERMILAVTLCRLGDKPGALEVIEEPMNDSTKNGPWATVIESMRRWVREYERGG